MVRLIRNEIYATVKGQKFYWMFVITMLFGVMWLVRRPAAFTLQDYKIELFRCVYYMEIFFSGVALSDKINTESIKYELSSATNRQQLWNIKYLAVVAYAITFWVISCLYSIVVCCCTGIEADLLDIIDFNNLLLTVVSFIFIAAAGFLISLLTRSKFVAELILLAVFAIAYQILPFFLYYEPIQKMITKKMYDTFELIPQYIITKWVLESEIHIKGIAILLGVGVVLFVVGGRIFKRMEI